MQLAYVNGALWSIGNGLIGTSLVLYLAREFGAARFALGISFVLAAPHIVGALRIAVPSLVRHVASRKRFTIAMFAASAVMLLGLPLIAMPRLRPAGDAALAMVVVLWSVFHLFQYLATVTLWSWMADIAPARVRGTFLGMRNRWMVVASIVSMLVSGAFVHVWQTHFPKPDHWMAYAIAAVAGAAMMLAALVPLAMMPALEKRDETIPRASSLRSIRQAFSDRDFRRLLYFGCWFSFFNGITQLPQHLYFMFLLGFGLVHLNGFRALTRAGQVVISPAVGRFADRFGNRPVLIASQLLVAMGPLFYFIATPNTRWWIAGAWIVWIAYAGINIAMPNLLLKLSPRGAEENVPYIAVYFALSGLFYAANVIFGGWLVERFADAKFAVTSALTISFYDAIFLVGWLGRTAGVLLLLAIIERGAYSWLRIWKSSR